MLLHRSTTYVVFSKRRLCVYGSRTAYRERSFLFEGASVTEIIQRL
jgi:hypothetical protein